MMAAQFVKYIVSGVAALIAHVAVLAILVELVATPPVVASAIGFVLASCLNYTIQRFWVFKAAGSHITLFTRYVFVTTITLLVNLALFWFMYHVIQLWYPVAQMVTTGAIFVLNFILNRSYTFRQEKPRRVGRLSVGT